MIGDPSGVWADYCAQAEADELRDELAQDPAGPPAGSRVPPIADATGPQATETPSPMSPSPAPALDLSMAEAWLLDAIPKTTGPLRTALSSALTEVRRERSLDLAYDTLTEVRRREANEH